jgi:hypothetical protein
VPTAGRPSRGRAPEDCEANDDAGDADVAGDPDSGATGRPAERGTAADLGADESADGARPRVADGSELGAAARGAAGAGAGAWARGTACEPVVLLELSRLTARCCAEATEGSAIVSISAARALRIAVDIACFMEGSGPRWFTRCWHRSIYQQLGCQHDNS